ncbi:MAG: tetratricopeptide repeat protein [Acidobacteriota bacterium]
MVHSKTCSTDRGALGLGACLFLAMLAAAAQAAEAGRLEQAGAQMRSGNLQAAEKILIQIVAEGGGQSEVHSLLGFIYDETGRGPQARSEFLRALELDPGSHRARNNLGAHFLRHGELAKATEQFRLVLQSNPDDVTANHNCGLIYLQQSDLQNAVSFLEKAHSLKPDDLGILFNLARCYFGLNRIEEGLRSVDTILNRTPKDDGPTLYALGALLLENRQYGPAADALERARKVSPDNLAALALLAEAQIRAGHTAEAWRFVDEFIAALKRQAGGGERAGPFVAQAVRIAKELYRQDPGSFERGRLLAELLYLDKEYAESLEVLQSLKSKGSRDPDYFNLVGMVYGGLNRLPEAAQAVIQAIQLAPERSDLVFNLAGLYQKASDNASAIQVLRRALDQGQVSPDIYFALGLSYFNLGNFSQAIESFQSAVRLAPAFHRAHFDLGRSLARLSRTNEAKKAFEQSLALNPQFYPAHYELALLQLEQQQIAAATEHLRDVLRLHPTHAEAHYQLGKILSQQKQTKEAVDELERAIQCNPDHDGAYNLLARIQLQLGNKTEAKRLLEALNERKQKRKDAFEKKVSGDD